MPKLRQSLVTAVTLMVLAATSLPMLANAAWFEATGQAIINNGNKALAKKQATQEAT